MTPKTTPVKPNLPLINNSQDELGPFVLYDGTINETTSVLHSMEMSIDKRYLANDCFFRKKYFSDEKHRSSVIIDPSHTYLFDFFDSHFDFGSLSLKLPGLTIPGAKHWDKQPFRFSTKTRDGSILFVVCFHLEEC